MNRNGEVAVCDSTGRERERYPVVYGARCRSRTAQEVKSGTMIHEWDPVPDADPDRRRGAR